MIAISEFFKKYRTLPHKLEKAVHATGLWGITPHRTTLKVYQCNYYDNSPLISNYCPQPLSDKWYLTIIIQQVYIRSLF